jgi:hypothetical protein
MAANSKIKRIRGHVEIHAETRLVDRPDEVGVKELVVDACRVEHRDGFVEFTSTPKEALAKVLAHHDKSRRKVERKNPEARVMWVTTVEWCNFPVGFEPPAFEVKS